MSEPQQQPAEAAAPLLPLSREARRRRVRDRLLEAQKRERDLVLAEFVKVRGLMPLLMKHRNGDRWTRDDRAELLAQMRALAHLSPYLVILALPGSFALLPVLAWWLDRRRHRREQLGGF